MISFKHKGSFAKTEKFLTRAQRLQVKEILERYAKEGVMALSAATPRDTGKTASSWDYRIAISSRGYKIDWINTHENDGVLIAILLQYGHGTGSGGYVSGRDYINPAIRPVFERLAENLWKEVTNL